MGFIRHVCRKNNIKLVSLNAAGLKYKARGGGFVITPEAGVANTTILYDDAAGKVEKNHIILHELGHILLGHTDNSLSTDAKELEANIFAAVILAIMLYKEYEEEKDQTKRRCSYGADALHSKGSCADSEMQRDQSIWFEGCGAAAVSQAGAAEMSQRSGGGIPAEV